VEEERPGAVPEGLHTRGTLIHITYRRRDAEQGHVLGVDGAKRAMAGGLARGDPVQRAEKTKHSAQRGLTCRSQVPQGAEQHLGRVSGFTLGTPIVLT